MILASVIHEGKSGFIAYFGPTFELTDKAHATMAKVIFEDGSHMFLSLK